MNSDMRFRFKTFLWSTETLNRYQLLLQPNITSSSKILHWLIRYMQVNIPGRWLWYMKAVFLLLTSGSLCWKMRVVSVETFSLWGLETFRLISLLLNFSLNVLLLDWSSISLLFKSVQLCSGPIRSAQVCSSLFRSVQGCWVLFRSAQVYSGLLRTRVWTSFLLDCVFMFLSACRVWVFPQVCLESGSGLQPNNDLNVSLMVFAVVVLFQTVWN